MLVLVCAGIAAGAVAGFMRGSAPILAEQTHVPALAQPLPEPVPEDGEDALPEARAVVLSHHFLSAQLIDETFSAIASRAPLRIVLVSPNHFGIGRGAFITTDRSWETPHGVLAADRAAIVALTGENIVVMDDAIFNREHGVFNIIPFVRKHFPNASIMPIAVDERAANADIDALSVRLARFSGAQIVIGSFDFSHELSSGAAEFHDARSIAVLRNLDSDGAARTEIDAKKGLRLVLAYAREVGAERFELRKRSDAAEIVGREIPEGTTSYIHGYFLPGRKTPDETITVLGAGDIMLDRFMRQAVDRDGIRRVFIPLLRLLDGNDVTLANLEGPFTDFAPKPAKPDNLQFTFDPRIAPSLAAYGFSALSLANNHTGNFGQKGLQSTRAYLNAAHIAHFGDPDNATSLSAIATIRGKRIGFVGFNRLFQKSADAVLAEIRALRAGTDTVIVMPHWGNEYMPIPSENQKKLGRAFIDAGADIVLGSHPHVMQPIEEYGNGIIFYSLGNFVFDQIRTRETREGLAVGLVIRKNSINAYVFPTLIEDWQVRLQEPERRGMIWSDLAEHSMLSEINRATLREKGVITITK